MLYWDFSKLNVRSAGENIMYWGLFELNLERSWLTLKAWCLWGSGINNITFYANHHGCLMPESPAKGESV